MPATETHRPSSPATPASDWDRYWIMADARRPAPRKRSKWIFRK